MSTHQPPSWSYCGHGADPATDPVGCRGIHVPGHTACLAHLADADRTETFIGQLGNTRKTERTRLQADYDRALRVVAEIDAARTSMNEVSA
ncbi:hypothetical protein [Streptomyces sp. NPDC047000]|uniref:hypothetical protein n=1 Tax=Streptomyces sp. NPDC047000 TaxID=3155474 RepID=UPI0033D9B75B